MVNNLNKEAFRKELEDCWRHGYYHRETEMKDYITTRLAAIEKVDGGKPQPITALPFIESMNFNEKNTILSNSRPITEEGMQDHDLNKLYEWLMDEKRQPAQTYFTSGVARNIAREIEYRLPKPLDDGIKYLIEDKNTEEWYGIDLSEGMKPLPNKSSFFTKDANEALHFNTSKEAQDHLDKFLKWDWCHVTEHKFVDDGQEGRGLDLVKLQEKFDKFFAEETEESFNEWLKMKGYLKSPFYCQSDIEDRGICSIQCDHCRTYYKPLEQAALPVGDGEGEKVGWFYCQSYFEEKGICKDQCDHCKEYYKPLEMVNRSNVKWVKAREVIGSFDEDKLLTFKSGGMNYTGWYHSDKNIFEDVLAGFFPIDSVYVLIEQQPLLPSAVTGGVKDDGTEYSPTIDETRPR